MNRPHFLSVIALLMVLVPACSGPAATQSTSSAAATANALTLAAAGAGQTATATASFVPTNTRAPAPTDTIPAPTNTQPPTATPTSTYTPGPTNTPTEPPPLAAIADICPLLDAKAISAALNDKIVRALRIETMDGAPGCQFINIGLDILDLFVAQDETAVKLEMNTYAAFEAAKNCAKPVTVNAAAVALAQAEFDQLGLKGNARVRASLNRRAMLIQQRGCVDKYGFLPAPGLGDVAFSERAFGPVLLYAVYRNTEVFIAIRKQGMTDQDMLTVETSFMATVLKEIEAR